MHRFPTISRRRRVRELFCYSRAEKMLARLLRKISGTDAPGGSAPPRYGCEYVEMHRPELPLDAMAEPWLRAAVIELTALQGGASLSGTPRPPEQSTEVRMIWDREALYAHFYCMDRCIWGRCEKHHDAIFEEEAVELFLNPEDRLERYYEFALSPWNIRYGALVRNEGGNPPTVRVVHYLDAQRIGGRVAIRGGGGVPFRSTRPPAGHNSLHESWTAVLRIPFSLFERPAPRPGECWKANLARVNRDGLAELTCWSPNSMHPKSFHHPGTFGVIQFVKRLSL